VLTILCLSTWSLSIKLLVFLLSTGSSTDWRPISIMQWRWQADLNVKSTYCSIAKLVSFRQPTSSAFQTPGSHCLQLCNLACQWVHSEYSSSKCHTAYCGFPLLPNKRTWNSMEVGENHTKGKNLTRRVFSHLEQLSKLLTSPFI